MFIDYLTLIMVNLVAGTALLAYFVYTGLDSDKEKFFAPAFGMVGIVALITGLHMTFKWPLPGSFNIAFGESTVLFGTVFLGTAITLAMNGDLIPISIYAFFAGLYSVLVGIRIIDLGLTKHPLPSGFGFILAGLGGLVAAPGLKFLKENKMARYFATAVLVAIALFWAYTFYQSLWGHLASFSDWTPATMGQ